MRYASIATAKMRSPLKEAMRLNPRAGRRGKKKLVVALVLTSLVDAFSILVLYLLVQNSGINSTVELKRFENLPEAAKAEALHHGTLVRVENGRYFIGEKPVAEVNLAKELQLLKAQLGDSQDGEALIIQAGKTSDFAAVIPIIRAGSITGFQKFRFAVLQGEAQL